MLERGDYYKNEPLSCLTLFSLFVFLFLILSTSGRIWVPISTHLSTSYLAKASW